MPDRLICPDYLARLAISLRTLDKSVRPTSAVFPNNPGTLVQSGTNQGIAPRSLDNLYPLSGLLLACPFGDLATCGARGIPRTNAQYSAAIVWVRKAQGPNRRQFGPCQGSLAADLLARRRHIRAAAMRHFRRRPAGLCGRVVREGRALPESEPGLPRRLMRIVL